MPDATCPADGALLRVVACGICGTDVRTFYNGDRRIEPGAVLGHEICGEVLEIGPDADGDLRAATGDLVHVISTLYCGTCTLCRTGNEHLCQAGGLMGFDYQGAYAELVADPRRLRSRTSFGSPRASTPCMRRSPTRSPTRSAATRTSRSASTCAPS